VHVGALSRDEASRWLGRPAPTTADRFTLAELFALRGDLQRIEETERTVRAGLYL
jgi:hypothetical protein